MYNIPQN